MEVIFHPRSEWTSRVPDNNSGTTRPLMLSLRPYMTVHYTGVGWHLANGQLRYPPIINSSVMVNIEAIADAGKKSFEYNYVIPVGANGTCHVWEYAGLYQAAHSFGENHLAFGVLLLMGVDNFPANPVWQPISEEMIYAIRWLRKYLFDRSYLATDHQLLPHTKMPDANTICPGLTTYPGAWNEISVPLTNSNPVPTGVDVLKRISKPTWNGASPELPWIGLFDSGIVRPMISFDIEPEEKNPNDEGGIWPISDPGQYKRICSWAKIEVPL